MLAGSDASDPLSFDGLPEFLPKDGAADDPALAVHDLDELFNEDPLNAVGDGDAVGDGYQNEALTPAATLELGGAEDYFGPEDYFRDGPATDPVAAAPADDIDIEPATSSDDGEDPSSPSEIQRAAREFERFAEQFHAFATRARSGGVRLV